MDADFDHLSASQAFISGSHRQWSQPRCPWEEVLEADLGAGLQRKARRERLKSGWASQRRTAGSATWDPRQRRRPPSCWGNWPSRLYPGRRCSYWCGLNNKRDKKYHYVTWTGWKPVDYVKNPPFLCCCSSPNTPEMWSSPKLSWWNLNNLFYLFLKDHLLLFISPQIATNMIILQLNEQKVIYSQPIKVLSS